MKKNLFKESNLYTAWKDIRHYRHYIIQSVFSDIQKNTIQTYLGALWWFLDPLLSMLVYVFYVKVIFNKGAEDFPIFVFCGTMAWTWTTKSLIGATGSITSKRKILQQVYIPKFLLPLVDTLVDTFFFVVGIPIIVLLGMAFNIWPSWHFFEFILVAIVQFTFLFAFSMLFCHVGVFFKDIANILNYTLRLIFFASPGMYALEWVPEKIRWLWWLNPMTSFFGSYRNVFMYSQPPIYSHLLVWFLLSLILIVFMIGWMYRFDKNYTKVI